jgi:hypothetical protein
MCLEHGVWSLESEEMLFVHLTTSPEYSPQAVLAHYAQLVGKQRNPCHMMFFAFALLTFAPNDPTKPRILLERAVSILEDAANGGGGSPLPKWSAMLYSSLGHLMCRFSDSFGGHRDVMSIFEKAMLIDPEDPLVCYNFASFLLNNKCALDRGLAVARKGLHSDEAWTVVMSRLLIACYSGSSVDVAALVSDVREALKKQLMVPVCYVDKKQPIPPQLSALVKAIVSRSALDIAKACEELEKQQD